VLSNIIDNAVEASGENGRIRICLQPSSENFILSIEDNGKGIPPDILPQLMQKGATFGKPNGSGLGLYHAFQTLKSWDGTLSIDSKVGRGTVVHLRLPSNQCPEWFASEIHVMRNTTVTIVDDDETIEQSWRTRFLSVGVKSENLVYFDKAESCAEWYENWRRLKHDAPFFFCDFELVGSRYTGLDLIERLGVERCSILVTSRFQDDDIIKRCARSGVPILPKCCVPSVPILLTEPRVSGRAI
jgi:hypothetical protein